MQGQFLKACALSVLIHLLASSIPLGRISAGLGHGEAVGQPGPRTPAPLSVALAPYAVELPSQSTPDGARTSRLASTASLVDNLGRQKGNRGNEAAIRDEIPSSPPVALASPSSIHYYRPQDLTRRARILRDVDPYLGELKNSPGLGKAVVVLWINEQGGVDRIKIENSGLPEPFETAIASQFSQSRFQPAERDGVPVKSVMKIEVEVLPRTRVGIGTNDDPAPRPAPSPAEK